jgi:deoxyribodipyrimidine photo-lyase
MNKYEKSIFIFHRDLRLDDNVGLIEALSRSKEVLPVFIFDKRQVVSNTYKSNNSVQFMVECLEDLSAQLGSNSNNSRLFYFYGLTHSVVRTLIDAYRPEAVFSNMDYTKFAVERDKKVSEVCRSKNVEFVTPEDYLLLPVGSVVNASGKIYSKFTPFFNKARTANVRAVRKNSRKNYSRKSLKLKGELPASKIHQYYTRNADLLEPGGRTPALAVLRKISSHKEYNRTRNDPNVETTHLSAYIKFGTVSIREVYWRFKKILGDGNDLVKQLFWREFYFNVGYGSPEIYEGKSMKKKYDDIRWMRNKRWLDRWKQGRTGFPIVDAGMRQMNATGFMHNRLRLVTADFLIKICGIDWREGEKYFAQTLYDYDWSVNNGNWQWVSGSGADSQPYFRVFNPWRQGKKNDPRGEYIKEWVPELGDVDPSHLHQWDAYHDHERYRDIDYPPPMLDYGEQKQKVTGMYKKIFD